MNMMESRSRDLSYVCLKVMPQTIMGLIPSGIYYGWGALSESINEVFSPYHPHEFKNQHGTFAGVIILALSVSLALPLRILLDKKFITEFTLQAIGLSLITIGLLLGGISVQFKILWLLYIGCAVPCGLGAQCIFLRIVFSHQLWFKRINYQNFGSGLFGFIIGIWAAFFFLISVPLEANLKLSTILYIYSAIAFISVLYPLLNIDDNSLIEKPSAIPTKEDSIIASNDIELTTVSTTVESKGSDEQYKVIEDNAESPENEEIELSYSELLVLPQMWILFFFFAAVLTPGWGIKLSFISMLRVLYNATPSFSASMTAIYVIIYAFGRFFSGILADYIGVLRTFDLMLIIKIIILIAVPQVTTYLPRDGQNTEGCTIFITLICILGLMYGGSKALFYSIIFDVFGKINYKVAFSISFKGFGLSVIIGGITSAYSFSETLSPGQTEEEVAAAITRTSSEWFYSMAAGMFVGLVLLHSIKPVDYNEILKNRIESRK